MRKILLAAAAPFTVLGNNALAPSQGVGTGATVSVFANSIFQIFLWVATVAAIFYLVMSGFKYITAGGDSEKAAAARTSIINAIIGVIIVLACFYIYQSSVNATQIIPTHGTTLNGL